MSQWKDEDDSYWTNSGKSFDLGETSSSKYNFEQLSKYSARSKVTNSSIVTNKSEKPVDLKSRQPDENLSYTREINDLICVSDLKCSACNKIITESGEIRFEQDKTFHNETCWRHWIDRFCEMPHFSIGELKTCAARKYFLQKICASYDGRLITKAIIDLKKQVDSYEFGNLMYDNFVAYKHYMAFLKESNQTDENLMRTKEPLDAEMAKFHSIVLDNIESSSFENFIQILSDYRDQLQITYNMTAQCELISEYILLLGIQEKLNSDKVSLVSNLSDGIAYDAYLANKIENFKRFKVSPEEFFWLIFKPIIRNGRIEDLERALNFKGFGSKPCIEINRIIAYLVYLDNKTDDSDIPKKHIYEAQMKFLSKISNIADLRMCSDQYNLTDRYLTYLKNSKDKKQLKKMEEFMNQRR